MRMVGGFCRDRKSTRLNSSHLGISYAVFCLKKKKKKQSKTKKNQKTSNKRANIRSQLSTCHCCYCCASASVLSSFSSFCFFFFFFFNDTATTEIYTLSLHDALPISSQIGLRISFHWFQTS